MKSMFAAFVLASLGLAVPPTAVAGPEEIPWQDSGLGRIGDIAQIEIGELNRFTGSDGTRTFLTMTENIPDGDEVGTMIGRVPGTEEMWFAIFRWNAIGYVKDDDKDKIDADALLTQLKEGTEAANKEREKHGWTKVHVLGWESPPAYDEQTHTLGWAVRGQTEGSPGESINYFTRLLGRHGVMSVENRVIYAIRSAARCQRKGNDRKAGVAPA